MHSQLLLRVSRFPNCVPFSLSSFTCLLDPLHRRPGAGAAAQARAALPAPVGGIRDGALRKTGADPTPPLSHVGGAGLRERTHGSCSEPTSHAAGRRAGRCFAHVEAHWVETKG